MATIADQLDSSFKRSSRMLALRGLVSVVFGVVLLIWPDISLEAMVLVFGAFAAAQGVFTIAGAVRTPTPRQGRVWLLVHGLVSVAFGVVACVWTDMTEQALLYVVGAWAIAFGVVELFAAIRLPVQRTTSILIALNGVLGIVFGAVMFASPDTGALALVALIPALAITTGTFMIVYAHELRGYGKEVRRRLTATDAEAVAQS